MAQKNKGSKAFETTNQMYSSIVKLTQQLNEANERLGFMAQFICDRMNIPIEEFQEKAKEHFSRNFHLTTNVVINRYNFPKVVNASN